MAYEELVSHLTREAEADAQALLARARGEAGELLAKAEEEAAAMDRRAAEDTALEILRRRRSRMKQARREAAAIRIRARSGVADRIMARLEERLSRLVAEPRYAVVAERLFRQILPAIPAGGTIVRADERVRECFGPLAADPRCRLLPLPEGEIGGLVVSDERETVFLRNTLRARLAKARPALAVEIGKRVPAPR